MNLRSKVEMFDVDWLKSQTEKSKPEIMSVFLLHWDRVGHGSELEQSALTSSSTHKPRLATVLANYDFSVYSLLKVRLKKNHLIHSK